MTFEDVLVALVVLAAVVGAIVGLRWVDRDDEHLQRIDDLTRGRDRWDR